MKRGIALAGLLALVVAACGGGAESTTSTVGGVEVPDVVGESMDFASGVMAGAGFDVSLSERVVQEVEEGTVVEQEPAAGTVLDPGSSVSIVIAASPSYEMIGTFVLVDSAIDSGVIDVRLGEPGECRGGRGYQDIGEGLQVTVRDQSGTILGTSNLSKGVRSEKLEGGGVQTQYFGDCIFEFTVTDLPMVDFYEVEVGDRGTITYSFDEMEAAGWEIQLSLG